MRLGSSILIPSHPRDKPQQKLKPTEVYKAAMSSISKLETKAKHLEQRNQEEEANELYINSIKAKLALLEQYNTK
jgi:hypothetical protein